jgi:cytochrome c556
MAPKVYAPAMRIAALIAALALAAPLSARAQSTPPARPAAPAPATAAPIRPVGTMSELMVHVIRPTSDAVFYITSRTPSTSEEWTTLQAQTLMLAESANLLLLPAHARNRAQWIADTRLMLDAGKKAFEAAKAKDVAALEALNDALYQSCVTCHEHFRPGYGKRPGH